MSSLGVLRWGRIVMTTLECGVRLQDGALQICACIPASEVVKAILYSGHTFASALIQLTFIRPTLDCRAVSAVV